jgi:hypothetical protein
MLPAALLRQVSHTAGLPRGLPRRLTFEPAGHLLVRDLGAERAVAELGTEGA